MNNLFSKDFIRDWNNAVEQTAMKLTPEQVKEIEQKLINAQKEVNHEQD